MIRWEDQQRIKSKMGLASENKDDAINIGDSGSNEVQIEQFSIEYSKSNRSKCKKCSFRVDKVMINYFSCKF